MTKRCPNCGEEYSDEANFCEDCGTELESDKVLIKEVPDNDVKKLVKEGALSAEEVLEEKEELVKWLKKRKE